MALTGCEGLMRLLGYECRTLDGVIELTTPLTLPGGAPVTAYIRQERSGIVEIDDGGEMLLEVAALGMLEARRFEQTFAHRVEMAGARFEHGRVVARARPERLWEAYTAFLRAALAVAEYVVERQTLERSEDQLVADIEAAIRARVPQAPIEHNVEVEGASGLKHRFRLKVNRTLVEPLRPSGRSTGPALRRILDVVKAGRRAVAVMDDRVDREDAEREARIVSAVAQVYFMSRLAQGVGVEALAA